MILILSVCFRVLKNWFVLPELMAMSFTFAVAYTLVGLHILKNLCFSPYRWVYLAGFVLPVILMAQTFPENLQDSVYVKKYKTIKIGFATGDFESSLDSDISWASVPVLALKMEQDSGSDLI